jgi:hypothetical protein
MVASYLQNPIARTPLPSWMTKAYRGPGLGVAPGSSGAMPSLMASGYKGPGLGVAPGSGGFLGSGWRQQPAFDPLAAAFNQANQQAIGETEGRYNDSLLGRQGLRDRALGDLEGYGDQQLADVDSSYGRSLNNQLSNLSSRGLAGSTITSSVTNASNRERAAAKARIQDDIINRKVGTDIDLSGELYGQMERRTDQQPNFAQLAQLAQQLGGAGIAPSGSGGPQFGSGGQQFGSGLVPGSTVPSGFLGGGFSGGGTRMTTYGGGGGGGSVAGASQYRRPGVLASGLDDVAGASIDRLNERTAANAFPQYGFGGGFGFDEKQFVNSFSPFGGGSRVGGHSSQLQPVAAAPAATAPRPSLDPTGDKYRKIAALGADPYYSDADTLVFNSASGNQNSFGNPGAFSRPQTVQGANYAGNSSVIANPVTGTAGSYSSFDTGGGGGFLGGGAFGPTRPLPFSNGASATDAARNARLRAASKRVDNRRITGNDLGMGLNSDLMRRLGFLF